MDCLKGYIGISSKVSNTAESGLYVDALPDISLQLSEATSEDGNERVQEMWQEVEDRGIRKFRTLVMSEFNRCHKITNREVVEYLIAENKTVFAEALWYLLGAELLLENKGSSRINRFTTIDRGKNKELRAELMDVFLKELQVAVSGIDIHQSACTDGIACKNNLVTYHKTII